MTPRVQVPAILRGKHGEVRCVVETWTERSSTGRVITRGRILHDPPHLADGLYEVTFAGQTITTKKWSGEWQLNFLSD